jgi:hypothetical protein
LQVKAWVASFEPVRPVDRRGEGELDHLDPARRDRRQRTENATVSGRARTQTDRIVMSKHRIYTVSFASVYPHYIAKAEKKGRTKAEVDEIILWLTGFGQEEFESHLARKTDFETFFAQAPNLNPARVNITGVVCGVRVEEIVDPLMRELRYLDKLIDELAKGKAMAKILRE